MFALADINSFYASCEKVFRPDLRNEPVIVLSNNDGCVIARSPEAKALGIRMGQPWFQVRQMRLEKKIHVFSSNYALYHSMSQRVMAVLESLSPAVEPYSIDEMFIDLRGINHCISPEIFGHQLREQVKSWTGLTMGVGIAPTKTLAKSAQWATKQWPQFSGVVALTAENRNRILKLLGLQPVGEVWGVGRRLNRPGFPGECFICELRLPDHRFRWKHNKLFLLLPEEYGPAFPAIVDCYTSPPT
ncbi:Mutagenesis and repair protein [Shigella sonnei]|nr:Mutagenesis and repair protein [Shigella sonnei]